MVIFFFFFFQAEDGIRDLIVTGVQTCALPISLAGPTGVGAGVAVLALAEAAGADAVDDVAGALPYKPPGALHAARKIGSPTIHNSRFMFCFASLSVAVQ